MKHTRDMPEMAFSAQELADMTAQAITLGDAIRSVEKNTELTCMEGSVPPPEAE
jgi:hypothetical protein